MELALIEVLMIKLASLALFAILVVGFSQEIPFPVPASNSIDPLRKFVTQVGDGRSPILCGIILTRKRAASSSSKILQVLATPPIATALNGYCFSDFGLSTGATSAVVYTIQVVCGLNFAKAGFLQTVVSDALISRSGVEIYHDRSKYALS